MKILKSLFILAALVVLGVSTARSQTLSYSGSVPIETYSFRADSLVASDTAFAEIYLPYKIRVMSLQAVACTVDTGAATPGPVVTLAPKGKGTAANITTATFVTSETVAYGTPASTVKDVAAGTYLKLKIAHGTSDVIRGFTIIIYYFRL